MSPVRSRDRKWYQTRNISRSRSASNGMSAFQAIYKAVAKIPRGKVSTYGTIAKEIGINNPRVVGYALHVNKDPDNIPCHRVVSKFGKLAPGYAFGGPTIQKQLLEQEGISFLDSGVDLNKHFFGF